jgi:hypothetical protein
METPKSTVSSRVLLVVSAALLVVGITAVSVAVANSRISSYGQSNQQLIDSVQNSPDFSLLIDSFEAPPVSIQSASSKEITGEVYQQLTGLSANSLKYITLPSVAATNNSNKTITAIIIALEDNRSSEHEGILLNSLSIAPGGSLSVSPLDWAQPRKNMLTKYVTQGSDVQVDTSTPTITSQEMWVAGSIQNFSITIGMVQFSDGTQWMTHR